MKNQFDDLFAFIICVGAVAILGILFFRSGSGDSGEFTAKIIVTDRYGKPVNAKPHVVCMAERAPETLICRVEVVK